MSPGAKILSDVPFEVYQAEKNNLPTHLARRAAHFFTESNRVVDSIVLWEQGKYSEYGALINESCNSSIYQYECGSEPLIKLHQIASETKGVLGSRFSGGGDGGCLVALVETDRAEQAIEQILAQYRPLFPEKADVCGGWVVEGVDGAKFFDA